jgi:hypothetical protein
MIGSSSAGSPDQSTTIGGSSSFGVSSTSRKPSMPAANALPIAVRRNL